MKKISKRFIKIVTLIFILSNLFSLGVSAENIGAKISSPTVSRIGGDNRVLTSVKVSEKAFPTNAETIILVGYSGEIDALGGTLLASKVNAPIIMTDKDKLTPATKAEIKRLNPKNIIILGGEAVVSKEVVNSLTGYNVERIDGKNREETAIKVAERAIGEDSGEVFLALGYDVYADALAIGSVTAKLNKPLLLSKKNDISDETIKALKDFKVKKVTIVGGITAVPINIENKLKSMSLEVDRVCGNNREETSIKIAETYFKNPSEVIVANGYVFADSVVGGYYSYKKDAPIILTRSNKLEKSTFDYVAKTKKNLTILGLYSAIDKNIESNLNRALKGEEVKDKAITVDQIPYNIDILEPDGIGTIWMNATYRNNTQYPITSISMTVLLKDRNKTTYLSNYDTVLPGQTSPIFDTFGPSTMKKEDYEILTIDVRAEKPNGKEITMKYDTRLKKYEYSEYKTDKVDGGVITVDQIPYNIDILEPDGIGTVWMNATYRNNTQYPITSISMTVLLKDRNKTTYLSNYDTVLPGQTSPIFDTFGPSTMKKEDYEILTIDARAEKPNGKEITMEYDTRLKKYEYSEY